MSTSSLPSGREFFRRFSLLYGIIGVGAAALILLYLLALLQLPPAEQRSLWWTIGAIALAAGPVLNWLQARFTRGLTECLDLLRQGSATDEQIRTGFATAIDLPRRCAMFSFATFQVASLGAAVVMSLRFESFGMQATLQILAASISGGMLANVVQFFLLKRRLAPIRSELARLLPDPEERDPLVTHLPLVRKVALALITIGLVPVTFSVLLAHALAPRSGVDLTLEIQASILDRAALRISAIDSPAAGEIEASLAQLQLDASAFGVNVALGAIADDATTTLLSDAELEFVRASGERGNAEKLHGENVLSWRRISKSAQGAPMLLTVVTPRASLPIGSGVSWIFALLLAVSAATALLVAWLMGSDIGGAAASLERQATRVAEGDLRVEHVFESEDELGRLGRSFARMAMALHTTVGAVASTASQIERTGGEIGAATRRVTEGFHAQAHATDQCVRSVEGVHAQATGIADSANALNMLAEESSSSVLEMSAAVEQLHETASVLSSKVEEVASAIEQSTRNLGEVNENTLTLSEAAEETSSSMEQMAAAMRQVDNSAEQTARISERVMESAEAGQAKVAETVRGMESIRAATASATKVINGLGERAVQIDSVLEVINDIAGRTGLLALNASIIAAQAGGHGRAFAVVATEIAELATRVRSSSEEIGSLIGSVQEESQNAIDAMQEGTDRVAHGVELAREAGESLGGITAAARESGQRSQEIVVAVREQSSAAGHVVDMMEQVSEGLGRIQVATEEQSSGHAVISHAATGMRDVAHQLEATTQEQARGVKQIRKSVEGVREAIESIHNSIGEQSDSCETSVKLLEQLSLQAGANDGEVGKMDESIRTLVEESETLREGVARFKV